MLHAAVSLATALVLAGLVWIFPPVRQRWLLAATGIGLAVIVLGTVAGWPLYPFSDVVVLAFGLVTGVLLGRAYPRPLVAFFVLLIALSALDVAQNLAFSGPPSTASTGGNPDPHLIWLNFRIPLPSGHFNIGFADLILIAAVVEHLRRNGAPPAVAFLPGVVGLLVAEAAFPLVHLQAALTAALLSSLVPFLTIGWLVAAAILRWLSPPSEVPSLP